MRVNNFCNPLSFRGPNGEVNKNPLKRVRTESRLLQDTEGPPAKSASYLPDVYYLRTFSPTSVDLLRAASRVKTQDPIPNITTISGDVKKDTVYGYIVDITGKAEVGEVFAKKEVQIREGATVGNVTVDCKEKGVQPKVVILPHHAIGKDPATGKEETIYLEPKVTGKINFPNQKGLVDTVSLDFNDNIPIKSSQIHNATYTYLKNKNEPTLTIDLSSDKKTYKFNGQQEEIRYDDLDNEVLKKYDLAYFSSAEQENQILGYEYEKVTIDCP